MQNNEDKINLFLSESNKIESVYDEDSLKQARYAWDYIITRPSLTTSEILKTHKILMLHQPLRPNEKGYFRRCAVWIGGREALHYVDVPAGVRWWCAKIKDHKTEKEIQDDHVCYEGIHPFVDGNGRTGRIFMNWQRVKAGLPILVIKEKEKQSYYDWFN